MWLRFDATTLWHIDAAEWAPSTTSFASACTKPERHFEAEHLGFLRLAGLNRSEDGPARRWPFGRSVDEAAFPQHLPKKTPIGAK